MSYVSRSNNESTLIGCLDVGSSLIHYMIGQYNSQSKSMSILKAGLWPTAGIRNGQIIDVGELCEALNQAIKTINKDMKRPLNDFYLSVDSSLSQLEMVSGEYKFPLENHLIEQEDLDMLVQELNQAFRSYPDVKDSLIDIFPVVYTLDQDRFTLNPLQMKSSVLGVKAFLLKRRGTNLQHLWRSLNYTGINIVGLVHSGLALGEVYLTPQEKHEGIMLVDIGAKGTRIYNYRNGYMQYDILIPMGGETFTEDIASALHCRKANAELLKFQYGFIDQDIDSKKHFSTEEIVVREVLASRMDSLWRTAMSEIGQVNNFDLQLPLRLCGGEVMVPGLLMAISKRWPQKVSALRMSDDEVVQSHFTNVYAMLQYLGSMYGIVSPQTAQTFWRENNEAITNVLTINENGQESFEIEEVDSASLINIDDTISLAISNEPKTQNESELVNESETIIDKKRNPQDRKRISSWKKWFSL